MPPKKATAAMYNVSLGANFKSSHKTDEVQLPIPAIFIVNQEGVIVWRQFNRDYKRRATVLQMINNLPAKH